MDDPKFKAKHQCSLDQKVTKDRFKNKVAVIVGGASGLGFATAERFANDGAFVALVDIDKVNGEKAENFLKSEGFDQARYYYADVTNKVTCEEAVNAIIKDTGEVIDFLINSAVNFCSRGLNSECDHWKTVLDVNVYGCVTMIQACHPFMLKASNPAIVNFSSIAGHRATPSRWTYAATKGAIKSMTRNMALDLAKDNIRVNSVSPGWTWSPEMAKASPDGKLETMLPVIKDFSILQRVADSCEIASVVTFLCSKDASFITASNIMVDGGYCALGAEGHNTSLFAGTSSKEKEK